MIVKHFSEEKIPRSTIFRIIKQTTEKISPIRKKGSGRIGKQMTPKRLRLFKKKFDHSSGKSQRKMASMFNITQPYVNYILKNKLGIICRTKKLFHCELISRKP